MNQSSIVRAAGNIAAGIVSKTATGSINWLTAQADERRSIVVLSVLLAREIAAEVERTTTETKGSDQ